MNTKGKNVKCAFCEKLTYKMPSRIHNYNFCCVAHRAAFAKSDKNKDFGKGWKHTPEEIEKIRQASLKRDYDTVLTDASRKKMADSARNRVWTEEMRENARKSHLGKVTPEEVKKKIIAHAKYGWNNKMWKGDFASYYAMHAWVNRVKGKASKCDDKGIGSLPCKGRFEWSNVDHKYKRNKDEYIERCKRHHMTYDLQNGLVHPTEKQRRFFPKLDNIKKQ